MRTVEEHLSVILSRLRPLPPFEQHLLDAHGHYLAEDVEATRDLPPFDNSAMDGYAVRLVDVMGADQDTPAILAVEQELPAGVAPSEIELAPGTCARIMTGAPVPPGADAIVPVEWTDAGAAGDGSVRIHRAPALGQHVRGRGEDVRAGQVVLTAGTHLGARQIGLLAGIGRDLVSVRPTPRVVVISTGAELVEPGTEPAPGQIHDSNSFTLATAAREAGAEVYRVGMVPDEGKILLDTIEDQLIRADLVITSGGVSMGAYEVVKETLGRLGTVEFTKVAMQPGMPQGFGVIGPDETPIFTLPGNPVSAFVSFEVFVKPALRALQGLSQPDEEPENALAAEAFGSPEGRRQFLRGRLVKHPEGGEHSVTRVTLASGSGSHLMGGLAHADCLIVVPEQVTRVEAGDQVRIIRLESV
ncbi:molybdopterin molybdotransferase MoeA [Actinospica sp. MGRD01-02]|uniref:Molybdopterin molybdenumtransferase n=1 Tax=Actinospica acidithermotolerans TaxID=2828514 RepID=A0A941ED04_9ACTN|nr:gephyrin-like molybdotransferase Glp [Actinospica acidithermotolerans]MBR7830480.1 molybdopterin molybdotransferase MoeA [Actinospica acidithermotolerans]